MTESIRGIIILEGADGTGKTTLARKLVDRYGARYIHMGVYADMRRWHLAAVRRAVRLAQTQLVVIDRLWLSEQVYGQVFRGGPSYDPAELDVFLRWHCALTVVCVRHDQRRHLRDFEELKIERPERFNDISQVVRLYADLLYGDMTKSGDTYLDSLIRFGTFDQRPDVFKYDMDKDRDNLHQVSGLVAARLRGLRRGHPAERFTFDKADFDTLKGMR